MTGHAAGRDGHPAGGAADLLADWHGADAVLGLSEDGGYWAIGLRRYLPGLFDGVPMSTDDTGAAQLERLVSQGLSVHLLPPTATSTNPPMPRPRRGGPRHALRPDLPAPGRDSLRPLAAVRHRPRRRRRPRRGRRRRASVSPGCWRCTPGCAVRVDELIVSRCSGPVIDVGCGPGRFVEALAARGLPVLGIDVSGASVGQTRARGASALRRNVFEPVPGEGRWQTLLLADGNVGIGGDPFALLPGAVSC